MGREQHSGFYYQSYAFSFLLFELHRKKHQFDVEFGNTMAGVLFFSPATHCFYWKYKTHTSLY